MLYFILNPAAGNGRSTKTMSRLEVSLKEKAIPYIIKRTQFPGHASTLAKEAVQKGYSTIISVGGDGTIFEIANGLVGTTAALGIIPAGTGNDFIRSLQIPPSPFDALQVILKGNIKKIDVGILNNNYFMNVAGAGFDADVLATNLMVKKFIKGKISYLISIFITLLGFSFKEVTLQIDNSLLKRKVLFAVIANGSRFGGGMLVAPKASIDDGYFDVCVVSFLPKWKIPFLIPKFIKGEHLTEPFVEYMKAKYIRIDSPIPYPVNVDGEIIGSTPIECTIAPEKLSVFIPTALLEE